MEGNIARVFSVTRSEEQKSDLGRINRHSRVSMTVTIISIMVEAVCIDMCWDTGIRNIDFDEKFSSEKENLLPPNICPM